MQRVYLFATGGDAEQVYLQINSYGKFYTDEILGFLDNNESKWGKFFHEFEVFSPEVLKQSNYDIVVICSNNYQSEIKEQLRVHFSIPQEKIISSKKYLVSVNIDCEYRRFLEEKSNNGCLSKSGGFDTSKTVIYTAIEGGWDTLKDPEVISEDIEYVCFTDDRSIKSDVWDVRYIDTPKDKNYALDIRKFKTCPHKYFPKSSITIWVDASFSIKKDLRDYVEKYDRGSPILLFPHPERKCIYQECGELIVIKKENPVRLIMQSAKYIEAGFPENGGLYAGGVLVRDTHNKKLCDCMEDWWEEIKLHSLRDQISLSYVLWKNKIKPDICNLNVYHNPYLVNNSHEMGHWRRENEK